MCASHRTEQAINARIREIDENAELSRRSGDVTFFEAQWVNLSVAEKREYVIDELSAER